MRSDAKFGVSEEVEQQDRSEGQIDTVLADEAPSSLGRDRRRWAGDRCHGDSGRASVDSVRDEVHDRVLADGLALELADDHPFLEHEHPVRSLDDVLEL